MNRYVILSVGLVLMATVMLANSQDIEDSFTVASVGEDYKYCPLCVQFMSTAIQELLQYILNAGVVGSCAALCGILPQKLEQAACDLLCDYVGIKAFVDMIQRADLDPIYFCEKLRFCEDKIGAANITLASVNPTKGQQGSTFGLRMEYEVTDDMGVAEIVVEIVGADSPPVGTGFLLEPRNKGDYEVNVELKATPSEQVPWGPGLYHVEWAICSGGSCGEKHGVVLSVNKNSEFTIVDNDNES